MTIDIHTAPGYTAGVETATLADMPGKAPTSIRLSDRARTILEDYSKRLGITQAAVMELALRQLAEHGLLHVKPQESADADRDEEPATRD